MAVDASPLILLGKISRLDLLLAIADEVVVPLAVSQELEAHLAKDRLGEAIRAIPGFVIAVSSEVPENVAKHRLGNGEAAVISYCLAKPGCRAVLDDDRGRRCARALGVPLIGTLGVVAGAKRAGAITSARSLLAAIRFAGYYIDEELVELTLAELGEPAASSLA